MGRRVLKFDGPLARGLWWRPSGAIFKGRASPPFKLPTPIQGGGWRAERDGRGRLYLWVRSAVFRCWLFAHLVPACRAPASFGDPLPPLRGPPPPASGGRQGLRAQSSPPCYLPTPFPGGGWRAQRDGKGRPYILHSFILSFMVLSISMQTSLK